MLDRSELDLAPSRAATEPTSVAYLVNMYPQPSQSFIRREIQALTSLGLHVSRFSLRRSSETLVDPADHEERQRTRVVLDAGARGLLLAVLRRALSGPRLFARALGLTLRLGRRSLRGPFVHLVYLAEACLLVEWLRKEHVAHLHAHFGTNSAAVAMLARLLGGPSYSLTIHGPEEFDQPQALGLREKVAHSAFTAAISEFGRSQLYRWCDPRDWHKLHIIRCGVDAAFLQAPPKPPPRAPKLVSVARLSPEKGQLTMIDALGLLADRRIEFTLVLIGDGPFRAAIEQRIRERGVQDRVRLTGWCDAAAVRDAMLDARALVVPSFAEGLPVVIMEALALGRPVVATSIAGIPELVKAGRTGWLVPPGSVSALAAAIQEALSLDMEILTKMGVEGAEIAAARHDAASEAAHLSERFADAIQSARSRPLDTSTAP